MYSTLYGLCRASQSLVLCPTTVIGIVVGVGRYHKLLLCSATEKLGVGFLHYSAFPILSIESGHGTSLAHAKPRTKYVEVYHLVAHLFKAQSRGR